MTEKILEKVADAFQTCPFIEAIVLGGSRATGTAAAQSDIDIGIYYRREGIDYERLNKIAAELDDAHRESLICKEGGWGCWVNCGGWLVINGCHVDLILRDWARVREIIRSTEAGAHSCHYQTGHPHAFLDVMYRGELASCRVLYAKGEEFLSAKRQAETYPSALKKSLTEFFLFEAGFSCSFAEKYAESGDPYYFTGHLFRSVSALNQVLFALNEKWLLNEKKAVLRIGGFPLRPAGYPERVAEIFSDAKASPSLSTQRLRALCSEVEALAVGSPR